jgi:hypothetical protein
MDHGGCRSTSDRTLIFAGEEDGEDGEGMGKGREPEEVHTPSHGVGIGHIRMVILLLLGQREEREG